MQLKLAITTLVTLAGLMFASLAGAHDGHIGLHVGNLHPLTGIDYLLMVLGVGIWAGLSGYIRRRR